MAAERSRLSQSSPWTYHPSTLSKARPFGRLFFRSLLRIEVTGRDQFPPTGPVLLVGNHSGYLDGPLVVAFAPRLVRTLTKTESYSGLPGNLLLRIGQIPLLRDSPDRRAMRESLAELRRGGVVAIFPEGTRGAGNVEAVKHGVGYLAAHADVQIVPVACWGTELAWPRSSKMPNRKHTVNIAFGAPFRLEERGDPDRRSTLATMTEEIASKLKEHLDQSVSTQ